MPTVDTTTRRRDGKKFIGIPDLIKTLNADEKETENREVVRYIQGLKERLVDLLM